MRGDKTPWEQCPKVWPTEAKFWSWVRGVLRKGWSRHPVKLEFIFLNRKRIINPKVANRKRFPMCWGMTCEICQQDTDQSNIEIDHIGENGKFTCLEDVKDYVEHLFMVSFSSLRALCKPCHKIVSHSQRVGCTFEQAAIKKNVIRHMHLPAKELLVFLEEKGYSGEQVSNSVKRKKILEKILKESHDSE